jgi:lysophospholipase L1-like esterase
MIKIRKKRRIFTMFSKQIMKNTLSILLPVIFMGFIISCSSDEKVTDKKKPIPCIGTEYYQYAPDDAPKVTLITLGDSLTNGTTDAAIRYEGQKNNWSQVLADQLKYKVKLNYQQPYMNPDFTRRDRDPDTNEVCLPTNLAVDGQYLQSMQTHTTCGNTNYGLDDCTNTADSSGREIKTTRVMGPYQEKDYADKPLSQLTAAKVAMETYSDITDNFIIMIWIGNNDTNGKAVVNVDDPFGNYTTAALDNNMTSVANFRDGKSGNWLGYEAMVKSLQDYAAKKGYNADFFIMTLPDVSNMGWLFSKAEVEYYYQIAAGCDTGTWNNCNADKKAMAQQILGNLDDATGDKINLLIFGLGFLGIHWINNTDCMDIDSIFNLDFGVGDLCDLGGVSGIANFSTNKVMEFILFGGFKFSFDYGVGEFNLEFPAVYNGTGAILDNTEKLMVSDRIAAFNGIINNAGASLGVPVIDMGTILDDAMEGTVPVEVTVGVENITLMREWNRGGGFSMDGIHPSNTSHAYIAQKAIDVLNGELPYLAADPVEHPDLDLIAAADGYLTDSDGDDWVVGATWGPTTAENMNVPHQEITEMLHKFKDVKDTDTNFQNSVGKNVDNPGEIFEILGPVFIHPKM